jgi:hypothetical protein
LEYHTIPDKIISLHVFVDLKPKPPLSLYSMLNSLTNLKLNLNHAGTKERLPNAQIVNAMGIQKAIAIYIRVASNASVIICPSIATASTGRIQLMCSLRWHPPRQLQRIYSLQGTAKEDLPPSSNQTIYSSRPHPTNHPHTARSILCTNHLSKSFCYTNPCACPPANEPEQESNGISELTALMKNLFDQMGTLLNLLTTVLTKLK